MQMMRRILIIDAGQTRGAVMQASLLEEVIAGDLALLFPTSSAER